MNAWNDWLPTGGGGGVARNRNLDQDVDVEEGGKLKLQLHDAIYRLRFYSNSLIHILSLSNSHNNVASIQKNRGDKSHRVNVALGYNYTMRFIAPILLYSCQVIVRI